MAKTGSLAVNITDRKLFSYDNLDSPVQIAMALLIYSPALQYKVADVCLHDEGTGEALWRCTTDTTGAFNPAHWSKVGGDEPTGTVKAFFGLVANIPAGWQICDGTNGTPDLRGRFVEGASIDAEIGNSGGSLGLTTDGSGSHDHGGNTGGTAINVNDLPAHSHKLFVNQDDANSNPGLSASQQVNRMNESDDNRKYILEGSSGSATYGDSGETGSDSTHNHSILSDGSHSHDIADGRPPFVRLYWIMKL